MLGARGRARTGGRGPVGATGELERLRSELAAARRREERLARRLEEAVGRDDLSYLFIVTYARSGSTLLQGLLNSIPGYLIRGENLQIAEHLYAFHEIGAGKRRSNRRRRRRHGVEDPSSPATPFFGIEEFAVRKSLRHARALVLATLLRPEPDTRVTGFKEVRWDREDLVEFVEWMRKVFPGARFIINTRDLSSVARSKIWSDRDGADATLERAQARILGLREHLGAAAFHVHYDDYIADPDRLAALFDWLGEPFDRAAIDAVLAVPHSY